MPPLGDDTRTAASDDQRELVAAAAGRVDAVLAAACPDLSRARLQRLIAAGHVRLNGEAVRKSVQVVAGDRLTVHLPPTPHEAVASPLTLPVLYEDDELVAIDKPAALAVHGAPGERGPNVAAWFLACYPLAAAAFEADRPGIVHRLDKDTSGVLLLAKTPIAQAHLSRAFEARQTAKSYLALCEGVPPRPHAVVDAPIARHPGDRTRMAIASRGRAARTEYEVVGSAHGRSLLLIRPETGRTHQIRVHLAAIGVPVVHDRVYGKGGDGRQLLHAWRLAVPHPAGGRLTVTAPLPADFRAAVRALGLQAVAFPYEQPAAAVHEAEAAPDPLPMV
ncbi:MAG: RluA family pseudouridine synthase [Dehalococcoidia bacterium]|nr:RluA family pseudouridine synthase [Dehalococcoidia bacterium]